MITEKKTKERVVVPISDTVPAPGNLEFEVDDLAEWMDVFPVEDPEGSATEAGHGTAQDVSSSSTLLDSKQ